MSKEELEQVKQDALKGLCVYDTRSPYHVEGGKKGWCQCDSCYSSLTAPAETLLELLEHIESLKSIINQLNNGTRKELPPV